MSTLKLCFLHFKFNFAKGLKCKHPKGHKQIQGITRKDMATSQAFLMKGKEVINLQKNNVRHAEVTEIEEIVEIDCEVIGDKSRKAYILQAIEEERCLVVSNENLISGFLIFDTHFFGWSFISLVIVSPTQRRKGCATALLQHFVEVAPTEKVFSSTNQSNEKMQIVFSVNGFVQSGIVENLDEGDSEIIYYKKKN